MSYRKALTAIGIACCLVLGGCDATTPSEFHTGSIQLKEVMKTAGIDQRNINADTVGAIADDFLRNGQGPIRIVVPFAKGDPMSRVKANAAAAKLRKEFAEYGVNPVINLSGGDDASADAVASYMALAAEPPARCHHMTGWNGAASQLDNDFGCEMKSAQAKMMSRPADLMGTQGTTYDDGKRNGVLVDKYRNGTPNPVLEGMTASGG